jgi:hypothetical protein
VHLHEPKPKKKTTFSSAEKKKKEKKKETKEAASGTQVAQSERRMSLSELPYEVLVRTCCSSPVGLMSGFSFFWCHRTPKQTVSIK